MENLTEKTGFIYIELITLRKIEHSFIIWFPHDVDLYIRNEYYHGGSNAPEIANVSVKCEELSVIF